MSDCRFGVSPVNYPDPDPDSTDRELLGIKLAVESSGPVLKHQEVQFCSDSQNALKILEKATGRNFCISWQWQYFLHVSNSISKCNCIGCFELRMSRLISFPGL